MNLKYENELIKRDAEFAISECEERAESRYLENDYVIRQFLKEFSKIAKSKGYIAKR